MFFERESIFDDTPFDIVSKSKLDLLGLEAEFLTRNKVGVTLGQLWTHCRTAVTEPTHSIPCQACWILRCTCHWTGHSFRKSPYPAWADPRSYFAAVSRRVGFACSYTSDYFPRNCFPSRPMNLFLLGTSLPTAFVCACGLGGATYGSPVASDRSLAAYTAASYELYFFSIGIPWIPFSFAYCMNLSFPPASILCTSHSFHLSMPTLLTKDKCTPSPLCFPEHSKHIKVPYVTVAHCGFFAEQSTHFLFCGSSCSSMTALDSGSISVEPSDSTQQRNPLER
mmetsp:Transcript_31005/g.118913  ORF Transcript_31005/g.118913 Transcript_31005/m.118913 type:complete len:281 (+) Transcript_31005:2100-2942(+)